jgi:gingipain R
MMLRLSIYLLYITVPSILYSQFFKVIEDKDDKISLSFSFSEKPFCYINIDNTRYIDFQKSYSVLTSITGDPCLPIFSQSVILPNKGKTSAQYTFGNYKEYNNVNILPCQPSKKRDTINSFVKNISYTKNEFYPINQQLTSKPFILRELRGQTISISPYFYNPTSKILRVYYEIRIDILITKEKGENEIINGLQTNIGIKEFSEHFINHSKNRKYFQKEENGEILILTNSKNIDAATTLANWKNEKGIKTKIALVDTIGNQSNSIKQFISSYLFENQNLLYVILVGDHNDIPSYSYGLIDREEYWSDSYYAQLIGDDLFPDVLTGRISGTNNEIKNIIDKIINYEKTPVDGNWMQKAIGIGSAEGEFEGDDNEADWQHLRNIKSTLLSTGFSNIYEFYDGSQGESDANDNPSKDEVISIINDGVGLINYTGHGTINTLNTSGLSTEDIKSIANEGKNPFVISVACNHGSYTQNNCIAQQFMIGNPNSIHSGAIAFCGSSILMDWAPPMQTQDEISEIIKNSEPSRSKSTLGGLFWNGQLSMLEKYGANGEGVIKTWIFFGDPSTEYRYQKTKETDLTYNYTETDSTHQLIIKSSIEKLKIGISYNNQYVTSGNISNGNIIFNISKAFNIDSLRITATKQNYATKSLLVNSANTTAIKPSLNSTNPFNFYPNPCSDVLNIEGEDINEILIMNCDGMLVKQINMINNEQKQINTFNFSNGMYILKVKTKSNNIINYKFIVQH